MKKNKPATPATTTSKSAHQHNIEPFRPDWTAFADRFAIKGLMALLALALLLRILNLSALSLWVDEFVHVLRARDVVSGKGPLFTTDNNGILLTICQLPIFKCFGSSAFWARMPSVLFGVGTVYMTYRMGERLFGRYVGFLAAFFCTFSLYLVFWSRISRNYAIFAFFFLLLGWVFLQAFEQKKSDTGDFWAKNGFSKKHLFVLPIVFIASLLSHQLTFFFVFSVAAYTISMVLRECISSKCLITKYLWTGLMLLPLLLVALVPGFSDGVKAALGTLLPERMVNWMLPDWAVPNWPYVAEKWAKERWLSFGVYHGVFRYDATLLYFPALAGFVAAFWLRWRSAFWLLSSFFLPFVLMCFVFREPTVPRYIIFIYPYFMLAAAAFFYFLWKFLTEKIPTNASKTIHYAIIGLPFVFGLCSVRWAELADLVLARKTAGVVADPNIGSFNFTNWQTPGRFVLDRKKTGDVLMATVPAYAAYYLNEDSVMWFRHRYLDIKTKQYLPYSPGPAVAPSQTFQGLKDLVQNNPRGWLLADYYMDNVFVDDSCRLFVYRNMHFYPEASPDGTVMVFGWDNSRPKPQNQDLVFYLNKEKFMSRATNFLITPAMLAKPKLTLEYSTRWVDSNKEAFILVNGENAYYLPPNTTNEVQTNTYMADSQYFKPGYNTVEIYYDVDKAVNDRRKGFVFYHLAIK